VQVGDGDVQNVYFTGRQVLSWPHRVGVVPALADGHQARRAATVEDHHSPFTGGS
jgi:hypothetical protein